MAGIKSEKRFAFPNGDVWVLMDDEWGVEINSENGKGGELVGLDSWDFKTRDAWMFWGQACNVRIKNIAKRFANKEIDEDTAIAEIQGIERHMPKHIKEQIEQPTVNA